MKKCSYHYWTLNVICRFFSLQYVRRIQNIEHRNSIYMISWYMMNARGVARGFTLGGTEAWRRSIGIGMIFSFSLQGCTFFSKKLMTFFSRHSQNVSSSSSQVHIFRIFQSHRTLLVQGTVLLYWIKQALRPLNRRLGGPCPPRGCAPDECCLIYIKSISARFCLRLFCLWLKGNFVHWSFLHLCTFWLLGQNKENLGIHQNIHNQGNS